MGEESQTIDLIKNLPTQTGNREKKPNNQLNKKSLNLNRRLEKKTRKDQAREKSKTFLFPC